MPVAFNEETGELRVLDPGGKWVKPVVAENPDTGERLYRDGEEWKPIPLSANERNAGRVASGLQGLLLGAGDEVTAAVGNPISAAKAAVGAEDEETGGYYQELRKFRDIENRFRRERPVEAFALTGGAGLGGALLTGGAGASTIGARLAPNAGRITQAAATGATYGGAAGFASGEGGLVNRLLSGVFGAGAGGVLGATLEAASPLISRFINSLRGNPALIDPQTGQLNQAGQQAAREAGIDPAQISQQMTREFGERARTAANPEQAAFSAEAASLPVPVRPTRGQITLRPDQQLEESQMAKDVYGTLAGTTMRDAFDAQQQALRANVPEIAQRIGGGQVDELGRGVDNARRALLSAEAASRARINQLYDAARATNGDAFVLGRNVAESLATMRQRLDDNGLTAEVAGRVHGLITRAASSLDDVTQAVGREPNISVGNLFTVRAQLTALQRSSDNIEAAAARQAKRSLDEWMNTAIDEDLIAGEPAVVELWRRAISSRREHARLFQADDLVQRLTERSRDGAQLKLDPQGAVNLIFGRSDTGWATRSGMVRDMQRLRERLGDTSPAWRSLKEEAFLRMARAGEGASTPTGTNFSGAKFAKAWETAQTKSPEVMRTLFTDEERRLVTQFANVARRMTTNVAGGNNTSNTGAAVAQATRRLFTSAVFGPKIAAFLEGVPFIRGLANVGAELRAQSAIMGQLQQGTRPGQPIPQMRALIGPGASATVQQYDGRSSQR